MDIAALYKLYLQHPSVETDTRKIKKGDIFFALKGPNFNGNDYVQGAIDAGASYCITDEAVGISNDKIITVSDSLLTLQQLAKKHREHFDIPFLAITGSNGKTTTKELIHAVLSSAFTTYTTAGNLNNHIGVPLTILKIKKDAAFAVIEMGANHLKEIDGYCSYTMPTHGIITNCGKAHLEGFGSEAAIKKAKGELFDYLKVNKATAFVCWDYNYLREMSNGIPKIIKYGVISEGVEILGCAINNTELLNVSILKGAEINEINTNLAGDYNLPNVLAAVAVGKTFGISDDKLKIALENYIPSNSRSQLIERNSNRIILDAYNANPSSMKVAIENFARLDGTKKVLMIGSMKELGADSKQEHTELMSLIKQNEWTHVVLVGEDFENVPGEFIHLNNALEAREWYCTQAFENTHLLIKGSRSMQMEKILE